ncbi:hypothetical protein ACQJBY_014059 [Aegilops geniculata]
MEAIRRAASASASAAHHHHRPAVAALHHRTAVAALHHRPAVAALHHRPAVAALHHRPDVAALHRRPGAPISTATARVAALRPSGVPICTATALHRPGAPIPSATARLPILRRTPPRAHFTPRRLCSQSTLDKVRSEIRRVKADRADRFQLTANKITSITTTVEMINKDISKPKYDASLDLGRTWIKVCGLVLSSGLALALVSFWVMSFGGGQGTKSPACVYVDKEMEYVKEDLLKKIDATGQ